MKKMGLLILLLMTIAPGSMDARPKTSKKSAYTEDLSIHRIKFEEVALKPKEKQKGKNSDHVNPMYDITARLDSLLDTIKVSNAQIKYIQGYTIQVYAGSSRAAALEAKNKLYILYPEARPEVRYKQPHYTIRIGRFLDRLESQKMYAEIKEVLPNAIIRPIYFPNEPNLLTHGQAVESDHP